MIDKEDLSQVEKLRDELKDLNKRLKRLEDKKNEVIVDSVQGSSSEFPYTRHSCKIEGVQYEYLKSKNLRNKYKKLIQRKEYKLGKLISSLEYELNYIEDSEIRQIIRHVYEDGKDYNQTAHAMNDKKKNPKYTADSIRMKLKRFLKKL